MNYELLETVFWTVIWIAVRDPGGECLCVCDKNDGNKKLSNETSYL